MSEPDNPRRRTNPEDYSEDEEAISSENAKGRYRSRVEKYETKADWPREPLYQVGETVFLEVNGRYVGYVIVSNNFESATYRLKRLDNGERHPGAVPESSLRVRES
ncbi:hypothetical protein LRP88_01738 [Fusarium phalaenopsidis]